VDGILGNQGTALLRTSHKVRTGPNGFFVFAGVQLIYVVLAVLYFSSRGLL
jgi:hypothetical protein